MNLRSEKKRIYDIYLQDPIGRDKEGNEVTVEDKLASSETYSIEEQVELKMSAAQLYKTIAEILDDRERVIIRRRYGMGGDEVTQNEIAKEMGISRSYVSRIEKKAVKKLEAAMNA